MPKIQITIDVPDDCDDADTTHEMGISNDAYERLLGKGQLPEGDLLDVENLDYDPGI